jgi:threonine/homoserine/homoserine lactone efflux protein
LTLPLLFLFSFVVSFGAVISPGPVSTAIVTESAKRGFIVGPLMTIGHSIIEAILVVLIAIGLSAGLNTPIVITVISAVGGVFLLLMGGSMLWDVFRGRLTLPKPENKMPILRNQQLVGLGILTTVLNPFWYFWWITVGASYILIAQSLGWLGVFVFFIGHILGDYLWNCTLSGVVGQGRKWLTDRIYRILTVIAALYFLYLGVTFLLSVFNSPV